MEAPEEASLTTISEALQRISKRAQCPHVEDCQAGVTLHFFTRFCNADTYYNCNHFAARMNELKTPMIWLQRLSIHAENQTLQTAEL